MAKVTEFEYVITNEYSTAESLFEALSILSKEAFCGVGTNQTNAINEARKETEWQEGDIHLFKITVKKIGTMPECPSFIYAEETPEDYL